MGLIKSTAAPVAAPKLNPITPKAEPKPRASKGTDSETMSKAEWAEKDLLKTKGGVSHDAATITASMSAMKSDDEVIALYEKLFDAILSKVRAA